MKRRNFIKKTIAVPVVAVVAPLVVKPSLNDKIESAVDKAYNPELFKQLKPLSHLTNKYLHWVSEFDDNGKEI